MDVLSNTSIAVCIYMCVLCHFQIYSGYFQVSLAFLCLLFYCTVALDITLDWNFGYKWLTCFLLQAHLHRHRHTALSF